MPRASKPRVATKAQVSIVDLDALSLENGEQYADFNDAGMYTCSNCATALYDSDEKLKHSKNMRLPAFKSCVYGSLKYQEDYSYGLPRQIAHCSNVCLSSLENIYFLFLCILKL